MWRHGSRILRLLWLLGFLVLGGGTGCDFENPFDTGGMSDDGNPRKQHLKRVAQAIDAPKPAQSFEGQTGPEVECFNTFGSFKRAASAAGRAAPSGYEWHHIVNQHDANKKRFGKRLHCTDNLIALPRPIHRKICDHYQSKAEWSKPKLVREALAPKSWREQYDYGLKELRKHGISP